MLTSQLIQMGHLMQKGMCGRLKELERLPGLTPRVDSTTRRVVCLGREIVRRLVVLEELGA